MAKPELRRALDGWIQSALSLLSDLPAQFRVVRTATAEAHEQSSSLEISTLLERDYERIPINAWDRLKALPDFKLICEAFVKDSDLSSILIEWVFGDALSLFAATEDPTPIQEKWVFSHIVYPFLSEYLRKTEQLIFNLEAFNGVYAQLEIAFFSPESICHQFVQHFWNLKLGLDRIEIAPGICLRTSSQDEWAEVIAQSAPYDGFGGFQGNLPNEFALGAILEVTANASAFPNDAGQTFTGWARGVADGIELGLRLFQSDWVAAKWAESRTDNPFPPGRGRPQFGQPIAQPLPLHLNYAIAYLITKSTSDRMQKHWKSLIAGVGDQDLRVPMIRFSDSYGRLRQEDQLIDYWIALEAMFLDGDSRSDMKERAGLAISNYLGTTQKERVDLKAAVMQSYNERSAVVHGDRKSPSKNLTGVTRQTRDLLARCIFKRLTESASEPKAGL